MIPPGSTPDGGGNTPGPPATGVIAGMRRILFSSSTGIRGPGGGGLATTTAPLSTRVRMSSKAPSLPRSLINGTGRPATRSMCRCAGPVFITTLLTRVTLVTCVARGSNSAQRCVGSAIVAQRVARKSRSYTIVQLSTPSPIASR